MTINDVRILKSRVENELHNLMSKREAVKEVTMAPNEDWHDYIDETVDELTKKILEYIDASCYLQDIISTANISKAYVEFEGKKYTLSSALYTVKMRRREAMAYQRMGAGEKRHRLAFNNNNNLVKVATYDINKFKELGQKLNMNNDEFSKAIDIVNSEVLLDIDMSKIPAEMKK